MRFWLAYRFSAADKGELRQQLDRLRTLMQDAGYGVVSMIQDIQNWEPWRQPKVEVVRREYELARECDAVLCIYTGFEPSEGRGWDAGFFAGMGKPTVMAIHKSIILPYYEALFTENPANAKFGLPPVIRYETFADIAEALKPKEEK